MDIERETEKGAESEGETENERWTERERRGQRVIERLRTRGGHRERDRRG